MEKNFVSNSLQPGSTAVLPKPRPKLLVTTSNKVSRNLWSYLIDENTSNSLLECVFCHEI